MWVWVNQNDGNVRPSRPVILRGTKTKQISVKTCQEGHRDNISNRKLIILEINAISFFASIQIPGGEPVDRRGHAACWDNKGFFPVAAALQAAYLVLYVRFFSDYASGEAE